MVIDIIIVLWTTTIGPLIDHFNTLIISFVFMLINMNNMNNRLDLYQEGDGLLINRWMTVSSSYQTLQSIMASQMHIAREFS